MNGDSQVTVYPFGDHHATPRDEVEARLYSVIPEDADVLLMEHKEKADNSNTPSQWAVLKNPSWLLFIFLTVWFQKWSRNKANRITDGSELSVAEEVAGDLDLDIEYTDLSDPQRFNQQPLYLTVVSWSAILLLLFGWIVHPLLIPFAVVLTAVCVRFSQIVFMKLRNKKMASDIRELGNHYSDIVFFTGESHVEPIKERLKSDVRFVEVSESRL